MRTSISITGSVDTLFTDFTRRLYPERMPVLRDLYLGGSAAPDEWRGASGSASWRCRTASPTAGLHRARPHPCRHDDPRADRDCPGRAGRHALRHRGGRSRESISALRRPEASFRAAPTDASVERLGRTQDGRSGWLRDGPLARDNFGAADVVATPVPTRSRPSRRPPRVVPTCRPATTGSIENVALRGLTAQPDPTDGVGSPRRCPR